MSHFFFQTLCLSLSLLFPHVSVFLQPLLSLCPLFLTPWSSWSVCSPPRLLPEVFMSMPAPLTFFCVPWSSYLLVCVPFVLTLLSFPSLASVSLLPLFEFHHHCPHLTPRPLLLSTGLLSLLSPSPRLSTTELCLIFLPELHHLFFLVHTLGLSFSFVFSGINV
jgi:hypothetical protein